MQLNLSAIKKVRCRLLDQATSKPVGGVVISLFAEVGYDNPKDRRRLPVTSLSSDSTGYVSFDLQPMVRAGLTVVSRLVVDAPAVGLQGYELPLGMEPIPGVLIPIPVPMPVEKAPCQAIRIPSIQSPDGLDYALSPFSFVFPRAVTLGDDCCETMVPSSLPVQERRFIKIAVGEFEPPEGEHSVGETISIEEAVDVTAPPEAADRKLRFGELLEFKQSWYSIGHSLGEIKHSLCLAPGEATEIAVIEWSREDIAQRTDQEAATEFLDHQVRRDRAIDESVEAALRETQDGWSLLGGTAGAFQATIPLDAVNLKGSADHAIGGGISHTSGSRNISGDSQQNLHDRVRQASSLIRSFQSAVIVHASQSEKNYLQTRRIANHNHCHALTIQYYEVLRHFRLRTEFVRRRPVVLIPFAPFAFTWDLALRFQAILDEVLIDPALKSCFDALIRLNVVPDVYTSSSGSSAAGGTSTGGTTTTTTTTRTKVMGTAEGGTASATLAKGDSVSAYQDSSDSQTIGFSHWPWDRVDPHGKDDKPDNKCIAPSLRPESLIYKIGTDGEWQQGDNVVSFTADRDGPLIFAINDEAGAFGDNSDYWAMVVQVTSKDAGGGGTSGGPPPAAPPYTKTDDEVCQEKLLRHLNGNCGAYLRAVWMLMDSAERRMLLEQRVPASILDFTDDVPLAISGNHVAFVFDGPLAGWTDQREGDPDTAAEDVVALPTRGLFAEAQLGHCNSCEPRDVTRMWDWTQMTTETPPEIQAVQPGPKGQPEPVPQPAPMPAPVVQITQPPAAPDPVGLAAAMKVLGTPNIFRDMSGMAEVSKLLDGLASGAVSLLQAQDMAKKAKAQLTSDGGAGGSGGGSASASRPQSAGDLYDKMQVLEGAKKQFGLSDASARQAALQYFNSDAAPATVIPAGYSPGGSGAAGGTATRPSPSTLGGISKLIGWAIDIGGRVLASDSDQLSTALCDAAVEVAKQEISNAVGTVPLGRALQLAVRYSMVFADGVGVVIVSKRKEIQKIVDEGANFPEDGLTPDDVARLQRARSYLALAWPMVGDALKAGVVAVVQDVLNQATGLLADAAAEVTSAVTGRIASKLLSGAKIDLAYQAVANKVGNDVDALRLGLYKSVAIKLARLLISSSAGTPAQRARLEQLVPATSQEPPPVAVLRGLLDIWGAKLTSQVTPLDDLVKDLPPDVAASVGVDLPLLVRYEAEVAIHSAIEQLVGAGWTFGSQSADSDMHADSVAKTILLPSSCDYLPSTTPTPPAGEVGLLEDELATDETALASVFDGLDTGAVLRAAAYQADVDAAYGAIAQRKYDDALVKTQNDAAEATSAMYALVGSLTSKYASTPLANEANGVLAAIPVPPASLRAPPAPGAINVA